MILVRETLEKGRCCLPCWGIAKCNSESDPFDVDPTPKRGRAVDFAFSWSLDEKVDQCNYKWSSIALIEISGSVLLTKGDVSSFGTCLCVKHSKDLSQGSGFGPNSERWTRNVRTIQ